MSRYGWPRVPTHATRTMHARPGEGYLDDISEARNYQRLARRALKVAPLMYAIRGKRGEEKERSASPLFCDCRP